MFVCMWVYSDLILTSDRISMKGRIAGGRIFHGRQCSVTPTSREHCSQLQHHYWGSLCCTHCKRHSECFSMDRTSSKIALFRGESRPHLIHGSSATWFTGKSRFDSIRFDSCPWIDFSIQFDSKTSIMTGFIGEPGISQAPVTVWLKKQDKLLSCTW